MLPSITPCVAGKSQLSYRNSIATQSPPAPFGYHPGKRCHTETLPTARHDSAPKLRARETWFVRYTNNVSNHTAAALSLCNFEKILSRNKVSETLFQVPFFCSKIHKSRQFVLRFASLKNIIKAKIPTKIRVIAHKSEMQDTLKLL